MQLKKKKNHFCAENQPEKSQHERLLEFFFFIELKPIIGFTVMPQYAQALSGTNIISRASSTKIRGEMIKATSAAIQGLKAKVEDIIVPSRSRNVLTLNWWLLFEKPKDICLIIVSLNPSLALSRAALTREVLLSDGVPDFVFCLFQHFNKCSVTCHYDLHAFAEQFFQSKQIMWLCFQKAEPFSR